jgi:hypothetical protein
MAMNALRIAPPWSVSAGLTRRESYAPPERLRSAAAWAERIRPDVLRDLDRRAAAGLRERLVVESREDVQARMVDLGPAVQTSV